ncbi:hypothetical protein VT930_18525 [Mycobacterium sherrisii]|nr:hypothetical protein [Mycobacterium sherrisii]MEC4765079.1 hypothetical protein [Mycobacterium sherrisii]
MPFGPTLDQGAGVAVQRRTDVRLARLPHHRAAAPDTGTILAGPGVDHRD